MRGGANHRVRQMARKPPRPPRQIPPRSPDRASLDATLRQAIADLESGAPEQAVERLRAILARAPRSAAGWNLLGVAQRRLGRAREATNLLRKAIALQPDFAEAHNNLGAALGDLGERDAAIASYQRALALRPDYTEARGNLARLARAPTSAAPQPARQPQTTSATPTLREQLSQFEARLRQVPDDETALLGRSAALAALGRHVEALKQLAEAQRRFPASRRLAIALAGLQQEAGQIKAAEEGFRAVLAQHGEAADVLTGLALIDRRLGRYADAEVRLRRALALTAAFAPAEAALGEILLQRGDYAAGWRAYAARWRTPGPGKPGRWQGEPLAAKRISVLPESGFGDTIQFARYLPMLARSGAKVSLRVPAPLLTLFKASFTGLGIDLAAETEPWPAVDYVAPITSLAGLLGPDPAQARTESPYLMPPLAQMQDWRRRVEQLCARGGRKVGLVWAARPGGARDRTRSPGLEPLLGLWQVQGVDIYCLQVGERRRPLLDRILPEHVHDLGPELADFAVTAAVMAALDLVITPCTAAAHLAGAMGRPVWLLLEPFPDWRWQLGRTDTPWYPTARLFRQRAESDWVELAERVAAALTAFAGQPRAAA